MGYDRSWKQWYKGDYQKEAYHIFKEILNETGLMAKYRINPKTWQPILKPKDHKTIARIAQELEQEDQEAKRKQEEIDYLKKPPIQNEINETWKDAGFKLDELDEDIKYWKEGWNDNRYFENCTWPLLQKLNKYLAWKYMKELKHYLRLYHTCEVTYDHTEWLTDKMMEAINKWDPNKCRHFRVFYEQYICWYWLQCIRKLDAPCFKGVDVDLVDFGEEETENRFKEKGNFYYSDEEVESMYEGLMEHYTTNKRGQLFADGIIFDFLDTLTKEQRWFYVQLILNLGEKQMTYEQLVKHLKMSMSTFQRRREELRAAWRKYNQEI